MEIYSFRKTSFRSIIILLGFINLACENGESAELNQKEISRCAYCGQCPNFQNNQNNLYTNNSNNNQNNNPNSNQAVYIAKDPTAAIVLTNFAQAAVHLGNIVADPKNKPVVSQNVCNIIADVANAAAQAFRNLKLDETLESSKYPEDSSYSEELSQETAEKIYRFLLKSNLAENLNSSSEEVLF